jgi:hypothetical protein
LQNIVFLASNIELSSMLSMYHLVTNAAVYGRVFLITEQL